MRDLEFIFYGLACFDPQPYGYRVLFPDGRNPPTGVPPHDCWIGVREQDEVVTAHWPYSGKGANNFMVPDVDRLQITGLVSSTLDDSGLRGRLGVITDSDANFQLSPNPEMMYDVIIDRGELSAHQQSGGMIVVQWVVQAQDDAVVRLNYGQYWIELTPGTTQVILGNTGRKRNSSKTATDFLLFRKLAKVKTGPLPTAVPGKKPLKAVTISHPLDERRSGSGFSIMCPGVDCSSAFSRA